MSYIKSEVEEAANDASHELESLLKECGVEINEALRRLMGDVVMKTIKKLSFVPDDLNEEEHA